MHLMNALWKSTDCQFDDSVIKDGLHQNSDSVRNLDPKSKLVLLQLTFTNQPIRIQQEMTRTTRMLLKNCSVNVISGSNQLHNLLSSFSFEVFGCIEVVALWPKLVLLHFKKLHCSAMIYQTLYHLTCLGNSIVQSETDWDEDDMQWICKIVVTALSMGAFTCIMFWSIHKNS